MRFDDTMHTQLATPTLTTLRVDRLLMGVLGVQLLVGHVKRSDRATIDGTFDVPLVVREAAKPSSASEDRTNALGKE
jgi:DNA-binding LacI/PurR family transcriptional regulator